MKGLQLNAKGSTARDLYRVTFPRYVPSGRQPGCCHHIDMIWKEVDGYEGLYEVSDDGTIRSLDRYVNGVYGSTQLKKSKVLKPGYRRGYAYCVLCKGGVPKKLSCHRVVAKTFIPNPKKKKTVNHKNGIKSDNRICNLEWSTASENNFHAFEKLGRLGRSRVLTSKQAYDVWLLKGTATSVSVGSMFGICSGVVRHIWRGEDYRRDIERLSAE